MLARIFLSALSGATPIAMAALLVGPLSAWAEESQTLNFRLPPSAAEAMPNAPCERGLNLSKLVLDKKLQSALIGGDAQTAQVLDSTPAVLKQLRRFGGATRGLVTAGPPGRGSQCESSCAILPVGARIRQVQVSNRYGANGLAILPGDALASNPDVQVMVVATEVSNTIDMGDQSGYEDFLISDSHRAVCMTAKNWSATEPSLQTVQIVFDR